MKFVGFLKKKKDILLAIIIILLVIFGLAVRVNQIEEEKKSSYDSDWRYHQYRPRTYKTDINTDKTDVNQVGSNNSSNDDPYGKQFYDDADDFSDDNAEEFGDGDEDDGWDDAYDYYNEEK